MAVKPWTSGGSTMTSPIINVADAPVYRGQSGQYFEFTMHSLAGTVGARAIGANVTRVPPGKAAFPLHHHHGNEEHFFILAGCGVLRVGDATFDVKPHDYIVNMPGDATTAHQLINTGAEDLVYLAISTLQVPEVVGYPDAAKTGVRIASGEAPETRFLLPDSAKGRVEYWEGEDGSRVAEIVTRRLSTRTGQRT